MKPGSLLSILFVSALLGLLSASPATALGAPLAQAAAPGVGELWEEFPLEEGRSLPEEDGTASDADGSVRPQGEQDAQRATPTPASGQPSAATPTPAAGQPAPATPTPRSRPAPEASDTGSGSQGGVVIAVLVLALAAAAGLLGFARMRRAHRERERESAYPVWGHSSNVYAEGATDRDGIGAFRGFVYAMGSDAGPDADRMICVNDPSRDEPIWVRRSEVDLLSSGRTAEPAEANGGAARPHGAASASSSF